MVRALIRASGFVAWLDDWVEALMRPSGFISRLDGCSGALGSTPRFVARLGITSLTASAVVFFFGAILPVSVLVGLAIGVSRFCSCMIDCLGTGNGLVISIAGALWALSSVCACASSLLVCVLSSGEGGGSDRGDGNAERCWSGPTRVDVSPVPSGGTGVLASALI